MEDKVKPTMEAEKPESPATEPMDNQLKGKSAVRARLEEKYTPEQLEQQRIALKVQKMALMHPELLASRPLQAVSVERSPLLDPTSPAFNPDALRKETDFNIFKNIHAFVSVALREVQVRLAASEGEAADPEERKALVSLQRNIQSIINSDEFKAITAGYSLEEIAQEDREKTGQLIKQIGEYENLEPYIEAELESLKKNNPQYSDLVIDDLLEELMEHGEIVSPIWKRLIGRAKKAANDSRDLERETGTTYKKSLALLGSIPNGDSLNLLYRVISASKGGRMVQTSTKNRHEKIKTLQNGDSYRFIRENKQSGSTVIIEINQADKYLKQTGKTFTKVLLFTLQKMTAQNFPLEVNFPLQELVDLGMYSTTSNASRAVRDFFNQQKNTTLSGIVKKGKRAVKEEGGVLFYHYRVDRGYVTLSVNENFNMEFIAPYFTVFPRFAYALSNNAFSLVRYIFFIARQNTQDIKDKGSFTISMEAVRENLGLPPIDEVKNRKYRQFIIEPIEKAIEEVETALEGVPEAKEYGFTITPHGTNTAKIREWLNGYLVIGLKGDFAETFIRIAAKAEGDRARFQRTKQAELARIAARKEAKGEP